MLTGRGRVEQLTRPEGREHLVHHRLARDVDLLERVGEHEAVHAHHHRHRQLLRDPEGDDVQVGGLLVVAAYSCTQPASRRAIESPWSFQMLIGAPIARLATVMTIGRPRAGGVEDHLRHEQQALAGRRGVGPRARRCGADQRREGGELRLHVEVRAVPELARADQPAQRARRRGSAARSGRRSRPAADTGRPSRRPPGNLQPAEAWRPPTARDRLVAVGHHLRVAVGQRAGEALLDGGEQARQPDDSRRGGERAQQGRTGCVTSQQPQGQRRRRQRDEPDAGADCSGPCRAANRPRCSRRANRSGTARRAAQDCRADVGSWTRTASGADTGSWLRTGRSSTRTNEATGAPVRSEPKLGNACACLPSMKQDKASSSDVVTTPCPPRPWIRTWNTRPPRRRAEHHQPPAARPAMARAPCRTTRGPKAGSLPKCIPLASE